MVTIAESTKDSMKFQFPQVTLDIPKQTTFDSINSVNVNEMK